MEGRCTVYTPLSLFFALYSKYLDLANLFVADAPSQSTLKYRSNGLPQDILSKKQKTREEGAYSAPPHG